MRGVIAALASAGASLALPVGLAVWVFLAGPDIDASGRPDNAPYRAAGFFLMLSPVLATIVAASFALLGWALRKFGRLRLASIILAVLCLSVICGVILAVQGARLGGLSDAAISFALFGGSSFLCLLAGGLTWWLLRSDA